MTFYFLDKPDKDNRRVIDVAGIEELVDELANLEPGLALGDLRMGRASRCMRGVSGAKTHSLSIAGFEDTWGTAGQAVEVDESYRVERAELTGYARLLLQRQLYEGQRSR